MRHRKDHKRIGRPTDQRTALLRSQAGCLFRHDHIKTTLIKAHETSRFADKLITLAPFGVSDDVPIKTRAAIKGVVPGIGPDDEVILWGGGIYNWFDPLTLIRAMDELRLSRPDVKLVFMGVNHPDYAFGPEVGVNLQAITLAKDLGLEGRSVFFLEGWVPYERIDDYLAEADASVCLGYENVESRFAFRTRYVDLFRARVPLLCTQGDVLADRVASEPMGITVPERGVAGVVAGIERLLDDAAFAQQCREGMARISGELSWDLAVQPLVRFCEAEGSFAMPADRRNVQAHARAGIYLGMKKLCLSPPRVP